MKKKMTPLHSLICQLQLIDLELKQANEEEELRRNAPPSQPRYHWIDLNGFDLRDPATQSQLLVEPAIPPKFPSDERFATLVKRLLIDIRGAKIYLQHDAYPMAKARSERLSKLEAALKRLEELSANVEIPDPHYINQMFLPDNDQEYCWDCGVQIIERTRSALIYSCMLLSRQYPRLAHRFWRLCQQGGWWWSFYYSDVRPYQFNSVDIEKSRVCNCCFKLLHYSLSSLGIDEESDIFLDYEHEMDEEGWWQLWVIFNAAHERGYPNYLADKLEKLISKYQLDSPRTSVLEDA